VNQQTHRQAGTYTQAIIHANRHTQRQTLTHAYIQKQWQAGALSHRDAYT